MAAVPLTWYLVCNCDLNRTEKLHQGGSVRLEGPTVAHKWGSYMICDVICDMFVLGSARPLSATNQGARGGEGGRAEGSEGRPDGDGEPPERQPTALREGK